jgi:hypothetical protein
MGPEASDVPAVESDCSGSGRIHPGDKVKEGGLSASIGANDSQNHSFFYFQGKVIDRLHPAEGFYDIMGLEDHILTI